VVKKLPAASSQLPAIGEVAGSWKLEAINESQRI
jgi:hypothetical protein